MMLWVFGSGWTTPSPSIVSPSLMSWPLASILPTRTNTRPASAGFHMNPPKMAPSLMSLRPCPGENGPTTNTLPTMPFSSIARPAPIGPWLPNARKPLWSGCAVIRSRAVLRLSSTFSATPYRSPTGFMSGYLAFRYAIAASAQALWSGTVSEPTKTPYSPLPPIVFASSSAWASPKPFAEASSKSQSLFWMPGPSCATTLIPASRAFWSTGSSAFSSFGTTPITFTFLAIKSSIARTCNDGSALVGPIMVASTPSLVPSSLMPASMALNHGIPPIFTTTPIVGLSAAKAPVASTAAKATPASRARLVAESFIIASFTSHRSPFGRVADRQIRLLWVRWRPRIRYNSWPSEALDFPDQRGLALSGAVLRPRIGNRGCRSPDLEFARQQDMLRRREIAFDPRAEPLPNDPAHLTNRLGDRRQGRRPRAHPCVVVEADQRDILRQAKPSFGHRRQHIERREIRQRLNRGRLRISSQPIREPAGRSLGRETELDNRRLRQTTRPQDLTGAAAALPDVGEIQRRSRDEDTFVTEVDQMTRANGARVFVVDRYGVGVRNAGHAVRDYVRRVGELDEFPAGKIVRAGNNDQSCRTPCQDRLQLGSLDRLFVVGTGDNDLVAVLAEALFDGRDNGREKRIVEIRNKNGDDFGLSRTQHRGEWIGAIVERLDRGFDLFDEFGADRLSTGQHVRNGARRDAGHPRHVIDRTCLFDHCLWAIAPGKTIYCKSFYATLRPIAREKSPSHEKKSPTGGSARWLDVGSFRFGRDLAVARRPLDCRTPRRPPALCYVRSTSIPVDRRHSIARDVCRRW